METQISRPFKISGTDQLNDKLTNWLHWLTDWLMALIDYLIDWVSINLSLLFETFSTSEGPKVCENWYILYILICKCASRHSGVQCQKVLRSWRVLCIFTSKCGFRHSGVQFLIFVQATWLRTRRCNEPTFGLTRRMYHSKNTAFRDFSSIWRGCIFCLLTFCAFAFSFWLLYLLFNCPYCPKLDF